MKSDKRLGHRPAANSLRVAPAFWTRPFWMRIGALNGLIALFILLSSDAPMFTSGHSVSIRLGAQIQIIHGMATFACATFMNIGAVGARQAPAFFLTGILLYCVPVYAEALGFPGSVGLIKPLGLSAFAAGWLIMAWSARDIDAKA